ncbi:Gamma-glutamyltranspeptidase @ Glutathione hydrolase [hydrothermal vent metagenome]|uniref:Gamma-glutamyltranspeptidase @ Glutathione hydrolase n=1 Tax=hydrothermal vent metagenome TaxID=652676 RepID=A0A3B0TXZ0_9ZZZZ
MRKPAVSSTNGLVTAQNTIAAAIAAKVLAEGGNAVDAAITCALAMGVVEPWMSGIGGGGLMTIYRASDKTSHVVDFSMVSSSSLDPDAYPLADGEGGDMFAWPRVKGDANVLGYKSICVPGAVDGLALALERFGSIGFDRALRPAIDLAQNGVEVNWFTTLALAIAEDEMDPFPEISRVFKPGGNVPSAPANGDRPPVIRQPRLAMILRHLAENGPRAFYQGSLALSIVKDIEAGGGFMTLEDLANYRAKIVAPLKFSYRDATISTTPSLTAGPTLALSLKNLAKTLKPQARFDGNALLATAEALAGAYQSRFADMGHAGKDNSCTTHLNVVDSAGNMVALTNTLLSRFGSKVLLPQSGILMNNAMMWFDPRPNRANSIAPGVRPLCNMCPTIVRRPDNLSFALGAAGGRQIVSAVAQLISLIVDHSLSLDEAIHQPRIDVSGGEKVTLDERLPGDWIKIIKAAMPARVAQSSVYPVLFAIASAVARNDAAGLNIGVAEPSHPLAGVVAEIVAGAVAEQE